MSTKIESINNPRIKSAARLRERRDRKKTGLILIDGAREIGCALDAQVKICEVYVCADWLDGNEAKECIARLSDVDAPRFDVTPEVLEKLAYGERRDGIVVVAERPDTSLSRLTVPDRPFVAVLESLEKPGNIGAILRSADAAGLDAVVLSESACDAFGPNVIRASIGNVFSPRLAEATNDEVQRWLEDHKIVPHIATPDAKALYHDANLSGSAAIVLGSEAHGVSSFWRDRNLNEIRLPMRGNADSLNVSTTAAVLFYEALRQRSTINK